MREIDRVQLLKPRVEGETSRVKRASMPYYRVRPGSYAEKLLQAGISFPPEIYLAIVATLCIAIGAIAFQLGLFLAIVAATAVGYFFISLFPNDRAERRRRLALPQIPTFIDALVSAIGTGYNLEGAIIHATESVPEGLLREELDRVVSALRRGLSLEEGMTILHHRLQGKEVISLTVSIILFYGLGGRILEPFRRLSRKIRSQQVVVARAQRDLVQIRQAFKILCFLSIFAPLVLLLVEPTYLKDALGDTLGRFLIQLAIAVELVALVLFKKITSIRI